MKYQVILQIYTDDKVDITKRQTKKKIETELLGRYATGTLFKSVEGINKVDVEVKATGVL
jgi:hypothetical protein